MVYILIFYSLERFNEFPEKWWNKFYASNTSNFFKDRKWLHQEFPILGELSAEDAPPAIILEVGAGAGNTAFPVMKQNHNPQLRLHACDFSKNAVEVIKSSPEFNSADMVGKLEASVWDIASPKNPETGAYQLPEGLEPESVDVVVLIFIFSALAPSQWKQAVENVWQLLKPGGIVLFRDYGRGDLAQVRFKKGRWMEENFYVRGDGTRVYFFDEDELKHIWSDHNENSNEELELRLKTINLDDNLRPKFEVVDFGVDRRMLVNRQRRLKMYRCWMQAKFRKTQIPSSPVNHS
jgi:tRNAThr (cytosine32-N3)-methyltransferase